MAVRFRRNPASGRSSTIGIRICRSPRPPATEGAYADPHKNPKRTITTQLIETTTSMEYRSRTIVACYTDRKCRQIRGFMRIGLNIVSWMK